MLIKSLASYKSFFEKHAVWFVVALSILASGLATIYYFHHNDILAYNDARSHLDIARRVFDSKTPGITQLGGVWLPLPHILMLPFIWNYTLWHTGLAGSFVSMISYVASCIFLFKIVLLLSKNPYASLLGSFLFMFNPNILYMQSTPMTELPLIVMMLFGSYYFIKWLYIKHLPNLILAAFGVMLSTLARYEGWFVLVVCTGIILFDGYFRTKKYRESEGNAILFATLGSFGIFLWILWNLVIFGNPLYFLDGPYSAKAQQNSLAALGHLPTKHNILLSLITTGQAVSLNVGSIIYFVALFSLIILVVIYRKNRKILYALLVLLAPVILDFITLVLGITAITTTIPYTFNIRYGIMAVPIVAVSIALLINKIKIFTVAKVTLGVIAIVACVSVVNVTLIYDASQGPGAAENSLGANAFIRAVNKNYESGNIMASDYTFDPIVQQIGIPLKNYVDEGSYHIWNKALLHPQDEVRYVMIFNRGGSEDLVYKDYLKHRVVFDRYYYVAYNKYGYELLALKQS
jgi:hypothetical protein